MENEEQEDYMVGDFWIWTLMHMLLAVAIKSAVQTQEDVFEEEMEAYFFGNMCSLKPFDQGGQTWLFW